MNTVEATPQIRPDVRAETGFVPRLESLRGFAALMVAGWHSFAVLDLSGWQGQGRDFLRFFFNGFAGVTVFFVLSGVVLGGSLARSRGPAGLRYLTFAIRRVLRIWPAYAVTGLFIAVMIRWVDAPMAYPSGVNAWFAGHWTQPVTAGLVLRHVFFLNQDFNPPSWTLRAEMLCSLALPAVYFVSLKLRGFGRGLILGVLMLLSGFDVFAGLHGAASWSLSLLCTWMFMFYLGLLLPEAGRRVMGAVKHSRGAWLIAPIAWLCLLASGLGAWRNVAAGVAAAVFVSALLYGPEWFAFKALDWPVARFYGRISYSFYLCHMISLFLIAKVALRVLPISQMMHFGLIMGAAFVAISTALATLLAWASNCWVERPAIALGRKICERINPKSETTANKSEIRNPESEVRKIVQT